MNKLERVPQYALSDSDLRELLGNDIPIIPYPELKNVSDIDDVFDEKGRCMILFLNSSPTSGHWCCMIRRPDSIEFFDPYGESPNHVVDDVPMPFLKKLDMDKPYLTKLLRAKGLPVYYNNCQFQKDNRSIATCGRHCAVRLFYAPYSLPEYYSIVEKSKMSPDLFVSGVTYKKIGK